MASGDYYDRAQGFYWVPKRVRVGSGDWKQHVVKAPTCPDQRLYRRLTRAERLLLE